MSHPFNAAQSGRQLAGAFRSVGRVAAVCHENPDADTVGGAIAVALIARQLGREVELISADPVPAAFDFLPLFSEFRPRPDRDADLVVVCDAATLERVGRLAIECRSWLEAATVVNIDHHRTNDGFGRLNCVDPTAAATCQVIVEMLPELGVTTDSDLATALLAGIVRDSHGFSDAATDARTLRAAAQMVEAGANIQTVHRRILAELPYRTLALWGRLLASMERSADGRVLTAILLPTMLDETGTTQEDADGFVEFMAQAREADVSVLLREVRSAETRVSLRVRDGVDATRIAATFGGGGHRHRAGCTIPAPAARAREQVVAVSLAVLAAGDRS